MKTLCKVTSRFRKSTSELYHVIVLERKLSIFTYHVILCDLFFNDVFVTAIFELSLNVWLRMLGAQIAGENSPVINN